MDTLTTWLRLHRWRATTGAVVALALFLTLSEVAPRFAAAYELYWDWQEQRAKLAEVMAWSAQKGAIEAGRRRLEAHFEELYVTLPKSDQISVILQVWQRTADAAGVTLQQVRPAERVAHAGYDELPFTVELRGPFHAVGRFADSLERSLYVMKVSRLFVTRTEQASDVLTAELGLSAIVFKEKAAVATKAAVDAKAAVVAVAEEAEP